MLSFGDLLPAEPVKVAPKKRESKEIHFDDLEGVEKPRVFSYEEQKRLKLIEPGNKIPVGNYQQVGQWCDYCMDVVTFAHNPEKKKLRCLRCKNDKSYK